MISPREQAPMSASCMPGLGTRVTSTIGVGAWSKGEYCEPRRCRGFDYWGSLTRRTPGRRRTRPPLPFSRDCAASTWGSRSSCSYRHRALRDGLFRFASLRRRRAGPRDAMAVISELRISDLTRLIAVLVLIGGARCLAMAIAPSTRQLATLPSSDFSFVPLQHGLVKIAELCGAAISWMI